MKILSIFIFIVIFIFISIFISHNLFSNKNESYKTQNLENSKYIIDSNIDDTGLIDVYSEKNSDIISNRDFIENPSRKNIKYDSNRYIQYNRRRVRPSF